MAENDEEKRLRAVTLQNATAIHAARQRAERELAGERERLRITLASIGDAVISTDDRGNVAFLNGVAESLTGWTQAEAAGRPLADVFCVVNEHTRETVENPALRALREGAVVGLANHTVLIARGGTERPIEDSAAPMRDEAGTTVGAVLVFRDVTERRRAEAALRAAEERSEFVRRASGVGFWYCDLPFDVLQWDERVKAHFWLSPDAPVTIDTFYARIHPDDRDPTRTAIDRSIADRTGYDVHYRTVNPDTTDERWVRAIGRTFYAADGTPTRFDGVTLDVTDQRRAEEATRASEARHRILADLAAATQPLADPDAIMSAAARLLAEHLDASRCAYAEVEEEAVYVITGDHPRGVPSIVGRWPVAAFGAEHHRLMRANEPYVVHDADADPRISPADLPAYRATRIRAVVCVPLHKGGRFTAAMAVHQAAPRRWTPEEVALVTTVVGRCWEALERTRAARALRANEERFRAFMDNSPASAWITDADGRIQYLSGTYLRMFRLPPGDPVGESVFDLFPEGIAREYVDNIRSVADSGRVLETVEPGVRPDGSEGQYLVYKFPMPGGDRLVGGVAIDVTERRQAEEAIREADRKKDDFLALLAHELRNPLAPIRNGLQVVRLSDDRGVRERAQGMMNRQLTHMVRLIDDLLDVSRINRNKMELRRERVLLADAVGSAVEAARPAIEAAAHEFAVDLPAEPVHLDADLTRLAQVFSNLLTNSAKYTRAGGRIRLSARTDGADVVVTVEDTGIGIPAESLANIFDMFSQVDRSIERSTGGLGIGLALVKGLVEMHGGTVSAASAGPDRGSEFTVRLPLLLDRPDAPASPEHGSSPDPAPGRRILVVDDNRDSAESMAEMLRLFGNEVALAHDGLEAVDRAAAFRPDVILMDVGMPRLNGLDATRRIRERPWGRAVTIIALTGWGQEGDRSRTKEAGCDGHLVKPVSLADLQKLLGELA